MDTQKLAVINSYSYKNTKELDRRVFLDTCNTLWDNNCEEKAIETLSKFYKMYLIEWAEACHIWKKWASQSLKGSRRNLYWFKRIMEDYNSFVNCNPESVPMLIQLTTIYQIQKSLDKIKNQNYVCNSTVSEVVEIEERLLNLI